MRLSHVYTWIATRFAQSLVNVERVPTFELTITYDVHRLNALLCSPHRLDAWLIFFCFILKGLLCAHYQLMEWKRKVSCRFRKGKLDTRWTERGGETKRGTIGEEKHTQEHTTYKEKPFTTFWCSSVKSIRPKPKRRSSILTVNLHVPVGAL